MNVEELTLITEAISKVSSDAAPLLGMYIGQGYFHTLCTSACVAAFIYMAYKIVQKVIDAQNRENEATDYYNNIKRILRDVGRYPSTEEMHNSLRALETHFKAKDAAEQEARNQKYGTTK